MSQKNYRIYQNTFYIKVKFVPNWELTSGISRNMEPLFFMSHLFERGDDSSTSAALDDEITSVGQGVTQACEMQTVFIAFVSDDNLKKINLWFLVFMY